MKTLLAKHHVKTDMSEADKDRLLIERHDEIETLLAEARLARARGQFAPLETLNEFFARARKRWKLQDNA